MTHRNLTVSENTFDQDALFILNFNHPRRGNMKLRAYVGKHGDEIFINQSGAMIKDSYTAEDRAATARLNQDVGVNHGDIVTIDGKDYTVKVKGDYSDAADLIEVK